MSRRIIAVQYESKTPNARVDTYFDKVIKYIPSDLVGAWVAVNGLIASTGNDVPKTPILWITFAIFLVFVALWTLKETAELNKPPAITQTIISTGAFAVWVFALGSPFNTLPFYHPVYGSILLIVYSLAVALISPKE